MRTSAKRQKLLEGDVARPFDARILRRARAIASKYRIALWQEDGEWYGEGVEESGAMGDGRTIEEAIRNTREALTAIVAYLIESGEEVVTPMVDQQRRRRRKAG